MNMQQIMTNLAITRPIFHSETDFQFALAWHIQQQYNDATIRLEYPYDGNNNMHSYLDIHISLCGKRYGIELKYKTKSANIDIGNESFHLRNQGADGNAHYDYWKDVQRLGEMIEDKNIDRGYAIFLTNKPAYWKGPKNTNYNNFSIADNHVVQGGLNWQDGITPAGATEDRRHPINIGNGYTISWQDYFSYNNQIFRYTCLEMPPRQ